MLSGYAMALQLGADIVVKMDGDDQMDPHYLPSLIFPIIKGEADYTKGNRFIHTYALVQMPLARRVGNFGLTFLTKLATGYWNIFDPNNGYTAIHSKVLEIINVEKIHRRYFFETSMLVELRHTQGVVLDIPIPARYGDEVSSLSLRRALIAFPFSLMKALLYRVGWQYLSLILMLSRSFSSAACHSQHLGCSSASIPGSKLSAPSSYLYRHGHAFGASLDPGISIAAASAGARRRERSEAAFASAVAPANEIQERYGRLKSLSETGAGGPEPDSFKARENSQAEADILHRVLFGSGAPAEIKQLYALALEKLPLASAARRDLTALVERKIDIEAMELALRRKDPFNFLYATFSRSLLSG